MLRKPELVKSTSYTGIVDYGIGNVRSVVSAVAKVGGTPILSSDPNTLLSCDRLILPGVGAFPHAMNELKSRGHVSVLQRMVENGRPILGICLGMQMMATRSLEFCTTLGLGFIAGTVTTLAEIAGGTPVRLPHVGWASLSRIADAEDWFFEGIAPLDRFYFIHSFAFCGEDEDVVAHADYEGIRFPAVIRRGSVIGTQFHPEKSGTQGLRMLQNFVRRGV